MYNEVESEDLDNSWINEFEKIDKKYEIFYTEDVLFIKIHCIYINKENEIEKINEEKLFLRNPNYISREEVIDKIKRGSFLNKKRYGIVSILKYNIDIEPTDVTFYMKNNQLDFLEPIKNIDAIALKKTIGMFQDLNDIFFIFNEKMEQANNVTACSDKNITKRIYITTKNGHNKTYRKTT
jgi:hypothetical protein